MLGWLKKKAAEQSVRNLRAEVSNLIDTAEGVSQVIMRTYKVDPAGTQAIVRCQQRVLSDIQLALQNGAPREEIVAAIAEVMSRRAPSDFTQTAIAHVLQTAANLSR